MTRSAPHSPAPLSHGAEAQPGFGSARRRLPPTADSVVRRAQVVRLALLIGLLLGGGVLGFVGLTRNGGAGSAGAVPAAGGAAAGSGDVFSLLVSGVAVVGVIAAFGAAAFLRRGAARDWEARADDDAAMQRVFQAYMSTSVLQGAALELPGLLGAVGTLVTGNSLLLIATAASVLLLAVLFPRMSTMERWVEEVTGGGAGAGDGLSEGSENS